MIHSFLWWRDTGVYAEIIPYILFDWYRVFWTGYVLPNLEIFLPILTGSNSSSLVLVLSQGRRVDQTGPPVATGWEFEPEAGVIGVIAAAIGLGLITPWVRWRDGHVDINPSTTTDLRTAAAD